MARDRWKNSRRPYYACDCGLTAWFGLSRGPYVCVIDVEDAEKLGPHNWRADVSSSGCVYAERSSAGIYESVHRVVMDAPSGIEVDHIDGMGLNNQKTNLRLATTKQNRANTKRRMATNTSGFKGVSFNKAQQKFVGYITRDKKTRHLGFFESAEEAAAAYDKEAARLFGEFAAPNSEMFK